MFKLTHILKIRSEVRMFLIGSSRVPTREGSFGPTPWSSSEGFLGAFTPRVWRILFFPLDSFSEYTSEVDCFLHRFFRKPETAKKHQQGRTPCTTMPTRVIASNLKKVLVILYSERPARVSKVPMGSFSTEFRLEKLWRNFNSLSVHRGEVFRIDLMNPRPQGILVSLKPTEEGPLGKAEIPENRTREDFIISLFLKTLSVVR